MVIGQDKVVAFHYRLSEAGGEVVEHSYDHSPVMYLHGHGNMLPGLEQALAGRTAGDAFSVTLPPEQGYGLPREDMVQRISFKQLADGGKKGPYKPGMIVRVKSDVGPQEVTVVKVGLKSLDVDTNHPMAGKTVTFAVEVVEVRDATPEEIQHGHAHGAGGHRH
jgi:FKBP-type peptidyl-prolyl cis-trans isomerase SlyD